MISQIQKIENEDNDVKKNVEKVKIETNNKAKELKKNDNYDDINVDDLEIKASKNKNFASKSEFIIDEIKNNKKVDEKGNEDNKINKNGGRN